MTKKWEVTVNGTNNVIEYKTELVGDDGGLSNYDR